MSLSLPEIPYLRYKSTDYNATTTIWDNTGTASNSNLTIPNLSKITYSSKTDGLNKSFDVVQGGTDVSFNITTTNITNFTLFTVARYIGPSYERIFTTSYSTTGYNGLYGFHSSKNGVSYNDYNNMGDHGWITNEISYTPTLTDWTLTTCYPYNCRCNGVCRVDTVLNGINILPAFGVNIETGERSDFQIADIIIYNKVLTFAEIIQAETYLFDLYGFNGMYNVNKNFYSLFMPKLTAPDDVTTLTNYKINDLDLNSIFQKSVNSSQTLSNYKVGGTAMTFQKVTDCIFTYSSVTYAATLTTLTITINGTNLNYIKTLLIFIGESPAKTDVTSTITLSSNNTVLNFNTDIGALTNNTNYTYYMYMADSSKQKYRTSDNMYDGNFYTAYRVPIFNAASNVGYNSFDISVNTLNYNGTITYYISSGSITQSGAASGLSPNTAYTVTAKYTIADGTSAEITKSVYTAFRVPTINAASNVGYNSFNITVDKSDYNGTITYYISSGSITQSGAASGLSPNTAYTVTVNYTIADGTSSEITKLVYTAYRAPTFNAASNIGYNSFDITVDRSNYNGTITYDIDSGSISSSNGVISASGLNSDTGYTVTATYTVADGTSTEITKLVYTKPTAPTINLSLTTNNVLSVSLSDGKYSSVKYSYDGTNYVTYSSQSVSADSSIDVYIIVYNYDNTSTTTSSKNIKTYPLGHTLEFHAMFQNEIYLKCNLKNSSYIISWTYGSTDTSGLYYINDTLSDNVSYASITFRNNLGYAYIYANITNIHDKTIVSSNGFKIFSKLFSDTTNTLNLPTGSYNYIALLIGGGGGGGSGGYSNDNDGASGGGGGGGGSGGIYYKFTDKKPTQLTIGNGGTSDLSGGNTNVTFQDSTVVTAEGGKGGYGGGPYNVDLGRYPNTSRGGQSGLFTIEYTDGDCPVYPNKRDQNGNFYTADGIDAYDNGVYANGFSMRSSGGEGQDNIHKGGLGGMYLSNNSFNITSTGYSAGCAGGVGGGGNFGGGGGGGGGSGIIDSTISASSGTYTDGYQTGGSGGKGYGAGGGGGRGSFSNETRGHKSGGNGAKGAVLILGYYSLPNS
jgi:hypothetical protein